MATDVSRQRFLIKDLLTHNVTLYPARAKVVRNVPDVVLQPGSNEIEIYGLTPTADEHSVQIEGQGAAATITDMTVDLVANTDIFEEVYPPDSGDESSESEEEEDSENEIDAVKAISDELKTLRAKSMHAVELQRTANRRLLALDSYINTVNASKNNSEDVTKILKQYQDERMETFTSHSKATEELADLNRQVARKEKEKWKAGKDERSRKEKLEKEKEKERVKKERQKAERRKEAQRVKEERMKFWPKKVYRVVLHLETPLDTPGSSRRGSIDSVTLAQGQSPSLPKEQPEQGGNAPAETRLSLSLSYVTSEASWRPRYDLSISSLKKTAKISYRAEFTNGTSETWKDAKVSLSTSQTSYTGLDDTVPYMDAWRVRLDKDSGHSSSDGAMSYQELHKPRVGNSAPSRVNRYELFGVDRTYIPDASKKQTRCGRCGGDHRNASCPYGTETMFPSVPAQASLPFGSNDPADVYAPRISASAQQQQLMSTRSLQEASSRPNPRGSGGGGGGAMRHRRVLTDEEYEEACEGADDDNLFANEEEPRLSYEESTWEEEGLTASYDVPGLRTLPPSSLTRRHKIASLTASNIHMSYICVPKLRCAAFLRAKVRNPSSSITLLKGSAGVTLDESFLGNMTLPRVSPGQAFDLPLGVDPAIHVAYPKPNVRRSTQGFINKESAQAFSRAVWLTNTRQAPVELLVLDQVPVSQDERLKIGLVQPKGLGAVGDAVRAGQPAQEGKNGKWGKAVATLKKNGEVAWNVTLEKGQACLLGLEYEARLPSTEKIVST
ncbi:hypothetical protein W97_03972 [Coniosporium apollinis CBS 100218]|uniref:DUF4139 domain-containing protein n=1 Tax=Coniosporium apollinis (strain CBS 100218) TaxID=1168221 RepID=R7YSE6_CONA1|nr:uncharacterized protein W97_03972 [Coniosporium apollinis CBS 100218]EON64739.1 hypothetical protein W97_03972 [Coniosporium apollinis CBS 100218]